MKTTGQVLFFVAKTTGGVTIFAVKFTDPETIKNVTVFVEKFTDHKPRKKCNDSWSWNLPSRKLKKWQYFVEKVKYKKPTENVLIFVEISTNNKSRKYIKILCCQIYWPRNCIKCCIFLLQKLQKRFFLCSIYWPTNYKNWGNLCCESYSPDN